MSNIHYITFSNGNSRVTGLPYSDTQKLLVDSIQSQTHRKVILHTHNLDSLKKQPWFFKIENYPTQYPDPWGRDGYYNVWKAFLAFNLMNNIADEDYIYYTDCSAYHREPFQQNIDRLFDYVEYAGNVCGSVGNDVMHNSFGCCDNHNVWKHIYPHSTPSIINKKHILASWFVFKKNEHNLNFLKEWCKYLIDLLDGKPLCTYHHTIEQSILNILAYKYDMKVFYNNTHHDYNKNHNNVHKQLNLEPNKDIENLKKWFYNPNHI